jgi:hypothetical protein
MDILSTLKTANIKEVILQSNGKFTPLEIIWENEEIKARTIIMPIKFNK